MLFPRLRADIRSVLQRDPAARSWFEALTCYPGVHALFYYRIAHWCWNIKLYWLGRYISHIARWLTGIEIHPGAKIAPSVFIDHGMGIVIGETAIVGEGCTIYQGVTLGGTQLLKGQKRHPTLGKNVIVGAGSQILGSFTVGDNAKIGSNAVVTKAVPADATAVGNPARIILATEKKSTFEAYAVGDKETDPVMQSIKALMAQNAEQTQQIQQLQQQLSEIIACTKNNK